MAEHFGFILNGEKLTANKYRFKFFLHLPEEYVNSLLSSCVHLAHRVKQKFANQEDTATTPSRTPGRTAQQRTPTTASAVSTSDDSEEEPVKPSVPSRKKRSRTLSAAASVFAANNIAEADRLSRRHRLV